MSLGRRCCFLQSLSSGQALGFAIGKPAAGIGPDGQQTGRHDQGKDSREGQAANNCSRQLYPPLG